MKTLMILAGAAALTIGSAAQSQMNTGDLKWGPPPPGIPAGAEVAVLSGDPGKDGMFTIRIRTPAGYAVPPHHHPAPELITVIDGQLLIGMGETADQAKAATLGVAGYIVAEPNMNHYVFTPGGATVQITSHGPFQIVYVNAADDPRNATAAERGQ